MDKPDWKDAPEDATHYGQETADFHESWYRQWTDGSWSCVSVDSRRVHNAGWFGLGYQMGRTDLEPRP